jgi:hypothetical protein
MLGYTKIQIMGNLGGTPEMKFLPSGDPVVNFSGREPAIQGPRGQPEGSD